MIIVVLSVASRIIREKDVGQVPEEQIQSYIRKFLESDQFKEQVSQQPIPEEGSDEYGEEGEEYYPDRRHAKYD